MPFFSEASEAGRKKGISAVPRERPAEPADGLAAYAVRRGVPRRRRSRRVQARSSRDRSSRSSDGLLERRGRRDRARRQGRRPRPRSFDGRRDDREGPQDHGGAYATPDGTRCGHSWSEPEPPSSGRSNDSAMASARCSTATSRWPARHTCFRDPGMSSARPTSRCSATETSPSPTTGGSRSHDRSIRRSRSRRVSSWRRSAQTSACWESVATNFRGSRS
jgi:hypothetical protein